MRPGLPLSIALHAAVIGWALLSFAAAPPFDSPPASDPIDVELLPPSQTSQPKLGQKTGKPSDQITPKDTKASTKESDGQRVGDTKTEEPPPPPPPETKPTPPVEKPPVVAAVPPPPPPPVEPKPEPPKPEPPKPVVKVDPPPAPTPPPPKPDLPKEAEKAKDIGAGKPPEVKEPPKDEKALEKLLDEAKKPDKPPEKKPDPKPVEKPAPKVEPIKTAAVDPKPIKSTSQTPSTLRGQTSDIVNHVDTGLSSSKLQKQASLGSPTGPATNLKLSQSETEALIGALKAQITPCWNPPPGASESGVKVTLAIALNQDGTLKAEEMIAVSPVSSPLASSIVSSAMRAVKMCASQKPFTLPADKYAAWALNHVTFDPKYQ